jgi:hypothetical protein
MDQNALNYLKSSYQTKPWFHDVGEDQYGRLVLYVNNISPDNLSGIPDEVNGKRVLVHIAASKTAKREDYAHKANNLPFLLTNSQVVELPSEDLEMDADHLYNELDKLKALCGQDNLSDLFYEIVDGDDAITDLSRSMPKITQRLNALYQDYGFDVISEYLGSD